MKHNYTPQSEWGGGAHGFSPFKGKKLTPLQTDQNDVIIHNKFIKSEVRMRKKIAFTLAEVLITLGIIGVVAAMTLPTVINNYKKTQTITSLKKAYTILNEAMKRSVLDNGDFKDWERGIDIGIDAFYKKYWHPYFKIIKVCNSYDECGYKSERPWRYVSNEPATILFSHRDYRVPFLTSDGFLYSFSIASGNVDSQDSSVFVDINGPKGPNIIGIDAFSFDPTDKNVFMPEGYDISATDCTSSDHGYLCAAKIIKDNWEIKDDYPWR